ncbi:hypothetical protein [Bacillus sp. FJAT-26390]|uniref:hypothetical protein n=1 Tax=Bacillus sp. FJAT-26390 TaxID=1743142 RepID=UPI000807B152|nr:hypothetical protein [Bacillus sp. FJAT-26390]OBZ15782.1 hypothetical protein A7975_30505 [Bacillus sp. FJAT-26390]
MTTQSEVEYFVKEMLKADVENTYLLKIAHQIFPSWSIEKLNQIIRDIEKSIDISHEKRLHGD